MTDQLFVLIVYAGLIFLTAAVGGILPLLVPNAREDKLKLFVSLGAGLLLGMAFLHIIPEASVLMPGSFGIGLLLGFLLLLVLERFVMVHACEEHGCDYHTIGVAAFAGLTVHGIIEGLALASSVMVSSIGPLVLVGILSHKAPAGFALTSLLKLAGKPNRRIVAFVLGVALSGPLGVLLAYVLLARTHWQNSAGILLSVSAGTF
jgi:zinc and cadmium transporter